MAKPATKSTTNALDPAATWEPIDSLTPWDKNPRKNDGKPVDRVAKSIERFGFAAPIVARAADRVIIAGHTRWKAARKLGMDKVPVRFVDLDPDQAAALALADNRLTEITPWDDDGLAGVLRDLEAAQVDLDGLGWDGDELKALLESTAPIDASETDDDVPEVDDGPAVSARGEVYHLGPHRLACGDNRDPGTLALAIGQDTIDATVTDPPYGIDASKMTMGSGQSGKPRADRLSAVEAWDGEAPPVAWLLETAPVVCVWGGNYFDDLPVSDDWLVWHKKNDGLSFSEAELAWTNIGKRIRVLQHHWGGEKKEHITQKPVAVIAWCLSFVPDGCVVFDPFAGSGTTMIAAAQTGRVARLIELDAKYCDLIRRRWHRYATEHGLDVGDGLP